MVEFVWRITDASGTPVHTLTYPARIEAAIRPYILYPQARVDPPGLPLPPVTEVEVRTEPDGRIAGIRLSRSSGVHDWDQAVLQAVRHTEVLPLDAAGQIPKVLLISFRPY